MVGRELPPDEDEAEEKPQEPAQGQTTEPGQQPP